MNVNEQPQVGGDHYRKHGSDVQHWDIAAKLNLDYFQGVISKYLFRWRFKGGKQDLDKGRQYWDKYVEVIANGTLAAGDHYQHARDLARAVDVMFPPEPVPMLLFCPKCRTQHIDRDERTDTLISGVIGEDWSTKPHRSHLCSGCGFVWRPSDVPTVGVKQLETRGQNDGDLGAVRSRQHTTNADFEWEGFKEGNVLYRCAKCRVHFNCPDEDTPYNVHKCGWAFVNQAAWGAGGMGSISAGPNEHCRRDDGPCLDNAHRSEDTLHGGLHAVERELAAPATHGSDLSDRVAQTVTDWEPRN